MTSTVTFFCLLQAHAQATTDVARLNALSASNGISHLFADRHWAMSLEEVALEYHGDLYVHPLAGPTPRAGRLLVDYGPSDDPLVVVERLVAAHEAADLPIDYAVTTDNMGIQVLPDRVRGPNGDWQPAVSPLATIVDLPPGPQPAGAAVMALLAQVSVQGTLVEPGQGFMNGALDQVVNVSGGPTSARTALRAVLAQLTDNENRPCGVYYRLVWLQEAPGRRAYILHIGAAERPPHQPR